MPCCGAWCSGGSTLALERHCCQAADVNNNQWWDGWVGALLAAAVTVGATIWWDARTRRRERLEDAVMRLNQAATEAGNEAQRQVVGIGTPENLTTTYIELGSAYLLVEGLARRRVALLSPALVAPAREGFGRTMQSLSDRWMRVSEPVKPSGEPESFESVVTNCQATSAACLRWISRPMTYWPWRDRSESHVRDMEMP